MFVLSNVRCIQCARGHLIYLLNFQVGLNNKTPTDPTATTLYTLRFGHWPCTMYTRCSCSRFFLFPCPGNKREIAKQTTFQNYAIPKSLTKSTIKIKNKKKFDFKFLGQFTMTTGFLWTFGHQICPNLSHMISSPFFWRHFCFTNFVLNLRHFFSVRYFQINVNREAKFRWTQKKTPVAHSD